MLTSLYGKKIAILGIMFLGWFSFSSIVHAETREYSYDSIKYDISVNSDSTFDVREQQSYSFTGTYHQAVRDIPYNKISALTDIKVIDDATHTPLTYSSTRLDKTNPTSWGKYTYYRDNDHEYIEWYYNVTDAKHTWDVEYKVHGGLGFYKDHDELYWNLFDSYTVPIDHIEVAITIPESPYVNAPETTAHLYSKFQGSTAVVDHRHFKFTVENVTPGNPVTIAVGWHKGIIPQSAFWKDFIKLYWGIILAGILFICFIIFRIFFWYLNSYRPLHQRTIIPEYEPANNVRPGEMGVIVSNTASSTTWAASIVDIAVRGYVKIIEEPQKVYLGFIKGAKNYSIERTQKTEEGLEEYEKKLLTIIFKDGPQFSTKDLRRDPRAKRELSSSFDDLKKDLLKETASDTHAYKVAPKAIGWVFVLIIGIVIFSVRLNVFSLFEGYSQVQVMVGIVSCVIFILAVIYSFLFVPRLNPDGIELKRKFLGFKLYLKTAERDRLQNLTPDLFQQFLPYAMMFGIEKQWAKAFETMTIPVPDWYIGPMYSGYGSPASMSSGFSASTFSASFSSSFASAFSSSTGTGGAGGGGSAGGGGGGGGGGAS